MLLLLLAPQPAAAQAEVLDLNQLLNDVFPQLNAAGYNDLVFWVADDFWGWLDEAAQRLARIAGIFARRESLPVTAGTGSYALPADQVATVQVDWNGTTLRVRSVRELDALDNNWVNTTTATPGAPTSPVAYTEDTMGLGIITIYPAPATAVGGTPLGLLLHVTPAEVAPNNTLLGCPTVLREYFALHVIGEARAKETKAAMPEVAQWMRQQVNMLLQVMNGYWGDAQ